MADILTELFEVVSDRKCNPTDGSYTCYLFDKGLDKILKKVGEEASEVIIAAKNCNNYDTVNEISDLLYHLVVLMAQQGISPGQLNTVLEERRKKIGNLKDFHEGDKNS
jgi:phosphoribosyl-ATP pyrophosphohydrolase